MTETQTTTERAAADLTHASEWLLAHRDLPMPTVQVASHAAGVRFAWHDTRDAEAVAQIIAAVPGDWFATVAVDNDLGWLTMRTLDGHEFIVFTEPGVAEPYVAARKASAA